VLIRLKVENTLWAVMGAWDEYSNSTFSMVYKVNKFFGLLSNKMNKVILFKKVDFFIGGQMG
jgi:hypothetical protein